MPSKNRIKTYVENGHYHIYNRGVAKQYIFLDESDYKVFLNYLREALDEPEEQKVEKHVQGRSFTVVKKPVKNFKDQISLLAYCLMPNHFHFLIKQANSKSIESFMRSLTTRYAIYFNKRYDRVGYVFQGRYKAVLVTKDRYLLHLTRYIHLNPAELEIDLTKAYSSYADYLGKRKTSWVNPEPILKFFNKPVIPEITKFNDYKKFVEGYKKDSRRILGEIAID